MKPLNRKNQKPEANKEKPENNQENLQGRPEANLQGGQEGTLQDRPERTKQGAQEWNREDRPGMGMQGKQQEKNFQGKPAQSIQGKSQEQYPQTSAQQQGMQGKQESKNPLLSGQQGKGSQPQGSQQQGRPEGMQGRQQKDISQGYKQQQGKGSGQQESQGMQGRQQQGTPQGSRQQQGKQAEGMQGNEERPEGIQKGNRPGLNYIPADENMQSQPNWNSQDRQEGNMQGEQQWNAQNRPDRSQGTQDVKSLFETGLNDLYSAEKALSQRLPKMMENATSPELRNTLKKNIATTAQHINRLEKIFKTAGLKANANKNENVEGILKETEDVMNQNQKGQAADAGIIAAGQKLKQYEVSSLGNLHTYAQSLGQNQVVDLVRETLNEAQQSQEAFKGFATSATNTQTPNASANPSGTDQWNPNEKRNPNEGQNPNERQNPNK